MKRYELVDKGREYPTRECHRRLSETWQGHLSRKSRKGRGEAALSLLFRTQWLAGCTRDETFLVSRSSTSPEAALFFSSLFYCKL
jgi:hypothetical protein